MAELAETRVAHDAVQLRPQAHDETAYHRPGGYEHPWSGHTNALALTYPTHIRKHRKQHQQVCATLCDAFQDCKFCYGEAFVGANVGPEGQLGKEHGKGNGNGDGRGANVGANVGLVGNGNGKGNGDGLCNGISNSNGIRFF